MFNHCVKTHLQCFPADKPSHWSDRLSWAEYNYNNSFHIAVDTTPFTVTYGQDPPPLIHFEWGSMANDKVAALLQQRDTVLQELRHHLHQAQQKMEAADTKSRHVQWSVGDYVYVKLGPYHQLTLAR